MAEALPRYCPRCGTPTREGMQYCATCELPAAAMFSRPDNTHYTNDDYNGAAPQEAVVRTPRQMQQANEANFSSMQRNSQDFPPAWDVAEEATRVGNFPPLSPLAGGNASNDPNSQQPWPAQPDPWSAPAQSAGPDAWNAPASPYPANNPATQAPWNAQPQASWNNQVQSPLPPAQAPRVPGKLRPGRIFLVLFILLLLIGGGIFAYSMLGGHVPGLNASQATIKTTNLNSVVTYAGATVTLLSVEQAQNFVDDPQSASNGMVRLNLQEQNTTTAPISWDYKQSAQLIVQGKPALSPTYVKSQGSVAPGATQKSVVDFAVANGGNLSTLIVQLGTNKEAQMQIPLNGQANLTQYQPKSSKQNDTLTYFGLNWTLTGSTTSWNLPGQQASSGMKFLKLDFTIDNPLAQQAISGSPFDYMRVKAGGQTATPVSTTVPVSFASGATGKQGSTTFLIPQNTTTCTLLMISQDPGGSVDAKIDFSLG